jgi:uncharacterized protein (TIGR02145 family)
MNKVINLSIYLSIFLTVSLNGQVINSQEIEEKTGIKRNAMYNLEEIKVRWKKAALENCTGVPCLSVSVPGAVSSIVATPTGPTSASVSFVPPTNDGGSPITGYTVTATPTGPAIGKRKSSGIIIVQGVSSPISVPGLDFGVNYIFTVVATNAVGGSSGTSTITTVTPCTLNTVALVIPTTLLVNTDLTPITHNTNGATGISTPIDLPEGVDASWSGNVITISGTPTEAGTFEYTIPLTGGCGSVNATGTITVTLPFICGTSTVSDNEGNSYNTVLIGQQCWTKENLKVTKYNNGDVIPDETYNDLLSILTAGARAVYIDEDTIGYVGTYGYLYNWYAATDERGICPSGWRLPSAEDWDNLGDFLGGTDVAGGRMKSTGTTYWATESAGTNNSSLFSALPGGYNGDEGYDAISTNAFFWSATGYDNNAIGIDLFNYDDILTKYEDGYSKSYSGSVRCIKMQIL